MSFSIKKLVFVFILFYSFFTLNIYSQSQNSQISIADSSDEMQDWDLYYDDDDDIQQEEKILNFHSDIKIQESGCMVVKEFIEVYADGKNIQRGIFRTIPLIRKNKYGQNIKQNFHITAVEKDGVTEPYTYTKNRNEINIRIGSKDKILEPGIYGYTITYETCGQVGFFDEFDELYWNVTGNGWDFKIASASATIQLPKGADMVQYYCYTGYQGSTASDCAFSFNDSLNIIHFESTNHLYPNEGLTVAVAFTRDIIQRPPPPSKAELFWMEYQGIIIMVLGALLLMIYYLITWKWSWKNGVKQVVIPSFNPPNDWSPAAIRYIFRKKFDTKIFVCTIISLAVKGYLQIKQKKKAYTFIATSSKEPLAAEEQSIYRSLFKKNSEIQLTEKYNSKFSTAKDRIETIICGSIKLKDYFISHKGKKAIAIIFSIIILLLSTIYYHMLTVSAFCMTISAIMFNVFWSLIKQKGCLKVVSIIPLFISLGTLSNIFNVAIGLNIYAACIVGMYIIYTKKLNKTTPLGAKIVAELEGFKMYLKTAEEHRLNLLYVPEKTPELYEKMLPYAMALDVENEWGKKFTNIFKDLDYSPSWHSSNDTTMFSSVILASALSSSLTSTLNRASTVPESSSGSSGSSSGGSWSSGSSGGGSSGGGGGGGGGGGW